METKSAQEEIGKIAYEIWQVEGEPEGRDQEHWERARRIFESRMTSPTERRIYGADTPEGRTDEVGENQRPHEAEAGGVYNPTPMHTTNSEGYVAVPSTEDVAPGSLGDDPQNARAPRT
jgi:hypothetical protein